MALGPCLPPRGHSMHTCDASLAAPAPPQVDMFQKPPKFPYVPGGDVSGIVEELSPEGEAAGFHKGDRVVAMFGDGGPRNGLAEYATVRVSTTVKLPQGISADAASALPSSALTAMIAADMIKKGDRVLVLGGAGGVGSHLVQLARHAGASFVAATSTQAEMLTKLGVDRVIDYRSERWWELDEFVEQPFTVVFDCVSGKQGWPTARRARTLVQRARYNSIVMGDNPYFEIHTPIGILKAMGAIALRQLTSSFGKGPKYKFVFGIMPEGGRLERLVRLVSEGKLQPVLESECPLPFTEQGVRRAFELQKSNHAHGKVVVHVADE
mmetsp:Transcript_16772/g.43389  ORF Transcript_16772/g.43389 Transcript_16772/m.43389 type:complete len:324 (-) Transcript_16772:201-1172(-)